MKKIALIGQMNVGKSTLFNRLIEEEKSIVSNVPGTTRDLNYGFCLWRGEKFIFIDTGGVIEKESSTKLKKETKEQIIKAIKQADLIFFVIEIRPSQESTQGRPISDFEREIGRLVKKDKTPSWLILNKADNPAKRAWLENPEWLKLGFKNIFAVSAANGTGLGDLLDQTVNFFKKNSSPDSSPLEEKIITPIKVSLIGRPNVGKSTLLNALSGEERMIVSNQPHTTRGPQDILLKNKSGKSPLLLVDTAGIRKKAKIKRGLEEIGVKKSLEMIKKSDIVLLVLDATEKINHQDKALIGLVEKHKKGLILVFNKCDLTDSPDQVFFVPWAPRILISAKEKKNINQIFTLIETGQRNRKRQIEKDDLASFLKRVVVEKKWPEKIWERITLEQRDVAPPYFVLQAPGSIIRRKQINPAQINIIKKEMRKKWNWEGTLIEIDICKI